MLLLRVLLVEDHPLMRAALSSLLGGLCNVIGTVERGDEVLSTVRELLPDVVILDISLPGRNGLQLLPELRREHPDLTIVMLTNRDQPVFREEAARRGADGHVLKDRASEELWPAIQVAVLARAESMSQTSRFA